MFWDKWIPKNFLAKSEVCAIEVCLNAADVFYYFTYLKNNRGKLEIISKGAGQTMSEIPNKIKKNKVPILLIINGKGVIVKKALGSTGGATPIGEIIHQNFPAINIDEFFIQLYEQADYDNFIVLGRREQILQVIDEVEKNKMRVTKVFLGAPCIIGLLPFVGNLNFVSTNLHKAEFRNGYLETLTTHEGQEKVTGRIEGLEVSPESALGIAAGISYLTQTTIVRNHQPELEYYFQSEIENSKFQFMLMLFVGFAFILTAGNMLVFSSYFETNNTLETQLSLYQGKNDEINQLLNDYQKNRTLIERAGILNKNQLSEYGDVIASSIPEEVVLSELYFNPEKENQEDNDSLICFNAKQVTIKGFCSKSFIINEWLHVLKMQKFIKDVYLQRFSFSRESILPNFEIHLEIK